MAQWLAAHSFTRLFGLIRCTLWQKWEVSALLKLYGTADGNFRYLGQPEQAYLPHLLWLHGTAHASINAAALSIS